MQGTCGGYFPGWVVYPGWGFGTPSELFWFVACGAGPPKRLMGGQAGVVVGA